MFLSREIDLKLFENYTKICIYAILYILWDIIVFRLVGYLLNMICLNLLLLYKYKISYIDFRMFLTQFYINFSRQEHQLDVLYVLLDA